MPANVMLPEALTRMSAEAARVMSSLKNALVEEMKPVPAAPSETGPATFTTPEERTSKEAALRVSIVSPDADLTARLPAAESDVVPDQAPLPTSAKEMSPA